MSNHKEQHCFNVAELICWPNQFGYAGSVSHWQAYGVKSLMIMLVVQMFLVSLRHPLKVCNTHKNGLSLI